MGEVPEGLVPPQSHSITGELLPDVNHGACDVLKPEGTEVAEVSEGPDGPGFTYAHGSLSFRVRAGRVLRQV